MMVTKSTLKFYKTRGFFIATILLITYLTLLFLPSWLFFDGKIFNSETLYRQYSISRNNFPLSYYKVDEVLTWCTVCITSILIIFINTIYYGWSFKDELMENRHGVKKWYFNLITILYFVWAFGTLICFFLYFFPDFNSFKDLLASTNEYSETRVQGKVINIDRQFASDISDKFELFVHHVEWFTIGTMILFILIDFLSYLVKDNQVRNTSSLNETTEIKLLKPIRAFVLSQLLIIDIPIIIGILLISFFVSNIPEDESIVFDSKSVFIAGGIGMHLIISQLIFLILNFTYKYKEFKIKNQIGL